MSSLSDCVLNHTWSIRSLSAFARPLEFGAARQGSSPLQEGMSVFLRSHCKSSKDTSTSDLLLDDHTDEDHGTYVNLVWLAHRQKPENDKKMRPSVQRPRKRQRPPDEQPQSTRNDEYNTHIKGQTSDNNDGNHSDQHLLIDMWVQDEPSAQVLLCFPQFSTQRRESGKDVQQFDFCLVRGSRSSHDAIFEWLESFCGCAVGKVPFCPSVAEVTQAMALWTTEQAMHQQQEKQQGEGIDEVDEAVGDCSSGKALALTFALPQDIEKAGLETISLTVPPVALTRLCGAIISHRSNNHTHNEEFLPLPNETEKMVAAPVDAIQLPGCDKDDISERDPLPVLRALQSFVRETFGINIQTLSLVRASCSIAVLSCDGRCRVQHPRFLTSVLREIRCMVMNRMGEESKCGDDGQHES